MKNIQRIPRPLGVTLQARSLNNATNKQEQLNKIKTHILNQYFINNQRLNNKSYTVDQIANYLQIPYFTVIRYMYDRLGYMQGFKEQDDSQNISVQLRVLISEIFLRALNHSQQADSQIDILQKRQQTRYVPYLTAELNRAIANGFAADKNLMDLHKLLSGTLPKDKVPNNHLHIHNLPDPDVLTVASATKLLNESNGLRLLTDPDLKVQLMDQYDISNMPEVRANYQEGVGTDNFLSSTNPIVSTNKQKHDKRREEAEGFVDVDEIE